MTKSVLLLCLVVLVATGGMIWGLTRVSAEVSRASLALDVLASRMAATERDLGTIADEVAEIADGVNAIADSLAQDDEDTEEGDAVGVRLPAPVRYSRSHPRSGRPRAHDAAERHPARRERHRDRLAAGEAARTLPQPRW